MEDATYRETQLSDVHGESDVYGYTMHGQPVALHEFLHAGPCVAVYGHDKVGVGTIYETDVFTGEWTILRDDVAQRALWSWVGSDRIWSYSNTDDARQGHADALDEMRSQIPPHSHKDR